ncbi:MAG: sulfotransferase [Pseudomonadota bacterium]
MAFDQSAFDAFQIIGAGRGGTSVLTGCIDKHPRCVAVLEAYSIPLLMGRVENAHEEIAEFEPRVRARVEAFLNACRAAAADHPGKLWGHKSTTEQIHGLNLWRGAMVDDEGFDAIGHFIARTAHLPTIYIVRDGRACVESKMRRANRPLDTSIASWKFSISLLQRMRAAPTPLLIVKMEDLVSNPEAELRRVAAFLRVDYDPVMLTGTANTKMRAEYQQPGFNQSTRMPANRNPPWIHRIAAELDYCGYAL